MINSDKNNMLKLGDIDFDFGFWKCKNKGVPFLSALDINVLSTCTSTERNGKVLAQRVLSSCVGHRRGSLFLVFHRAH